MSKHRRLRYNKSDGDWITGKQYVPLDHDCPSLPWEDCYCDWNEPELGPEQAAHMREILTITGGKP